MRPDILARNFRIFRLYEQGVTRKQIAYRRAMNYEAVKKIIQVFQRRRLPRPDTREIVSPFMLT